jgi:hypothetical protein
VQYLDPRAHFPAFECSVTFAVGVKVFVDLARRRQGLLDDSRSNCVERDAVVPARAEDLQEVPRDSFAFSIRVSGKENLIGARYESLEPTDHLSAALGELLGWLKSQKIDGHLFRR